MWLLSPETYVVSSNSNANEHYGLNPSQFFFFLEARLQGMILFPQKSNHSKQTMLNKKE
jgi:hypothetical protein